jgi:thymidylate synthase (FAD)
MNDLNSMGEIKCLDHGFVRLVDTMPAIDLENAIVQAARVSYGKGTKSFMEDRSLIRYLMRHRHTTPFEMVEFKFHCKMPIFVARQWIRHRTASVNEVSARYSEMPNEFYVPNIDEVRKQSTKNKQATDEVAEHNSAHEFLNLLDACSQMTYMNYQKALAENIGREQARMLLPLNIYTEWYWKIDLKNLLDFLALRCDKHAQYEIRVYADAMLEMVEKLVPSTISAWNDFNPLRGGMSITWQEFLKLREILKNIPEDRGINLELEPRATKRENEEWVEKWAKLTARLSI